MSAFINCSCGGKALYDCDGCGHEWVTCETCKFEIERYQSKSIEGDWGEAVKERHTNAPCRRYLRVKTNE
ncbi:hypothetical protein AB733_23110 [Photobacterium swingsii]|uniref:Uncharacterized protein n=1 Tax=Photobacterium swingsii TaxID=680026 RepID=A0A0J8V5W5_9GAMM|nr:hypothetical protein AB733_23110 [Photobacterium swingsii]PSW24538.1 hypothetical protein C9I94_10910 [Photobacterium swingsii]